MTRTMKFFITAGLFLAALTAPAQDTDISNPKPLPDDFTLPLPGGQSLVFRPVSVGPDKGSFAARVFKIGDRAEGGFQEFPTDISVGGAVSMELENQRQWVYFLGKYEVSEAQWHAVMGTGTEEEQRSAYPKRAISWFEAQEFVHKLNQWLFQNALERLPKNQDSPCFIRLPTEAEWEFAARGGIKVSPNEFDRKHPYAAAITEHEWFSGPRSSNDKVKRVGRKNPNPLGLHDMLGNVAEMTCSQYSVEYYQGRVGGMVTRGGHFFTNEDKIRASARDELPVYNPEDGYKPRRMETLGLRLVLSSPIFVNPHIYQQMEAEWEEYRKVRTVPTLASPSAPNRAAQAAGRVNELAAHLETLQKALEGANAAPDVMSALGLAVGAAQNIQADANTVERLLATTLVEAAFYHARIWADAMLLADKYRFNAKLAAEADLQKEQREDEENARMQDADAISSSEKYSEDIRRLGGTSENVVSEIIEEKIQKLALLSAAEKSSTQLEQRVLLAIQAHLTTFRKFQRVDADRYKTDFLRIHSQNQ